MAVAARGPRGPSLGAPPLDEGDPKDRFEQPDSSSSRHRRIDVQHLETQASERRHHTGPAPRPSADTPRGSRVSTLESDRHSLGHPAAGTRPKTTRAHRETESLSVQPWAASIVAVLIFGANRGPRSHYTAAPFRCRLTAGTSPLTPATAQIAARPLSIRSLCDASRPCGAPSYSISLLPAMPAAAGRAEVSMGTVLSLVP